MTDPNWKAGPNVALLDVDNQVDFHEGGALGAPGSKKIIPVFNDLRQHFSTVIHTADDHSPAHSSFKVFGPHCVSGTEGAKIHPDIVVEPQDLKIYKGRHNDKESFSAFEENDGGYEPTFDDDAHLTLEQKEHSLGIDTNVIVGLVKDICVAENARSSLKRQFRTIVVLDATVALNDNNADEIQRQLEAQGVEFCLAEDLPRVLASSPPPRLL